MKYLEYLGEEMTLKLRLQRYSHKLFRIPSVFIIVGGLICGIGPMPASAVPYEPTVNGSPTITVEKKPIYTSALTEHIQQTQTRRICTALQKVDLPHISSTTTVRAVQAHGAWNRGDCNADWAVVTTQIDQQGIFNFFFAVGTQGNGMLQSTVGMPTGAKNRVTAQYVCNGTDVKRYRAWTDVDIVGIADLSNKVYSAEVNLACG